MKVNFSLQKNTASKPQKLNPSFEAGLTPKFAREIINTDASKISDSLAGKGIPNNLKYNNFKDNNVIAWYWNKGIEIFEELNKRFGLNLGLAKGIYIKDFAKAKIKNKSAYGFCNVTRTKLIKGSNEKIPSRVIFFNTFETFLKKVPNEEKWHYDWNYIDSISDFLYKTKQAGTDFFLDPILHEFSHAAYIDKLLKKFGGEIARKKILSAKNPEEIRKYREKYGDRISQICNYALKDPLEAIACDMSVKIIASLNKETLMPTRNPFIGTAYEEGVVGREYSDSERPLDEILRKIWNGEFE